ncbi:3624_t:CDS:2 [Paraglomus occultum]|uniref:3624_t:CDS:1 n=1 Tax=Paraglomus occultum TaxID=144539 RepID=A0A9N8VRC7_9GLOM|nr:3624_t:CDS:2 [Paraglomus occultum]
MPAPLPTAVRSGHRKTKENHTSNASFGLKLANGRTGAPQQTMYNKFANHYEALIQETFPDPLPAKSKKTVRRPSTPHGNKSTDFIKRNRQAVSNYGKQKDDSPPVSPQPTLKRSSGGSSTRSITPHGQSSLSVRSSSYRQRSVSPQSDNLVGILKKSSPPSTTTVQSSKRPSTIRRPTSPPSSPSGLSSHKISHDFNTNSLEAQMRVNKHLKKRLDERDELLREKDSQLEDYADVVEALRERIYQVEARNRELFDENESLKSKLEEAESRMQNQDIPTTLSQIAKNVQRVKGDKSVAAVVPQASKRTANATTSAATTAPVNSMSPTPAPISTTTSTVQQSSVISSLIASRPTTAAPAAPVATPLPATTQIKSSVNPSRLAPAPVTSHHVSTAVQPRRVMPETNESSSNAARHPGGFGSEMFSKQSEFEYTRQALANTKRERPLNSVMEESDESDEEKIFEGEVSDEQDFSSSDTLSSVSSRSESDSDSDSSPSAALRAINAKPKQAFPYMIKSPIANPTSNTLVTPISNVSVGHISNKTSNVATTSTPVTKPQRRLRRPRANSTSSSDSGIGSTHENGNSKTVKNTNYSMLQNNGQSTTSNNSNMVTPNSSLQNNIAVSSLSATSQSNLSASKVTSISSGQSYIKSTTEHRESFSSESSSDSSLAASQRDLFGSSVTSNSSVSANSGKSLNSVTSQRNFSTGSSYSYTSANSRSNPSESAVTNSHVSVVSSGYDDNDNFSKNNANSNGLVKRSSGSNGHKNSYPNSVTSSRSASSSEFGISLTKQTSQTSVTSQSSANNSTASLRHGSNSRLSSQSTTSSSRSSSPSNGRSSRARSPAHESSQSNKSTASPIPSPPPPPASKDTLTQLQHFIRLLSETCSRENPLKRYDVKKMMDEGSSAKVYSARQLGSDNSEERAIKIVPLTYSLEFIFNEIYVLKNLKHENIVDFKESFLKWDGKTREVWLVMEKCVRGDVTSKAGKVSQREVGRIAGELLKALTHLHAHGIIHRDIKLSNILSGANNEIKLADFGISSLTPTSTTGMVGTIPYMAPDVVLVNPDRPYDTKVDIWSLGVCILELLTGKAAWGRIRDDEIMLRLRKGEKPYGFERMRKKAEFGWEAVDFLERCFAKDSENRLSAEELLEVCIKQHYLQ